MITFVLTLFISLIVTSNIDNPKSTITPLNILNEVKESNPKNAGYWNLTFGIIIDDTDPLRSWSYTSSHYDWCNGAGIWDNPYIIENVSIDANGGIGIDIKNSNTPFILRNCTFFHYSSSVYAIKMLNVNNSKIYKNILSESYAGITLENCYNNTISENIINTNPKYINHGHLIYMKYCDNNIIQNNFLNNSNNRGISLANDCDKNLISENIINNTGCGIHLEGSGAVLNDNIITNNLLNENGDGIRLVSSINNCTILENKLINNGNGIEIESQSISNCNITYNILQNCGFYFPNRIDNSNNIDKTNLINGKYFYYYRDKKGLNSSDFMNAAQIALDNCNHSLISEYSLSHCSMGIRLISCTNVSIFYNNVCYNIYGILLKYSSSCKIVGNNISYGGHAISLDVLDSCYNNNISRNIINGNTDRGILITGDNNIISENILNGCNREAIAIYKSENMFVYKNNISNTDDYAITLNDNSENISIIENRIENCENGIYLEDDSDYNNISKNCIFNSSVYGINIQNTGASCDYNNITENVLNNNQYGIYLEYCDYNTISGNNLTENSLYGIYIDNSGGFDNLISNNLMYGCGIYLSGYLYSMNTNDIDISNKINNKKCYQYAHETHLISNDFLDAGQIILIECNDSDVSNVDVSNGSIGIHLYYSNNITINNINSSYNSYYGIYDVYGINNKFYGNNLSFNYNGIAIRNCKYNNLSLNIIDNNNYFGILISWYSQFNTIVNNTIYGNKYGIYIDEANNNTFIKNEIDLNNYGIYFFSKCESNNFYQNSILINLNFGVYIYKNTPLCKYNLLFDNIFNNPSGINAQDSGSLNKWDNGSIGNYWDDYKGIDGNDDGIGDTPYNVPGTAGEQDHFPIWEDTDDMPPKITIITPENNTKFKNSPIINITVYDRYGLNTTWYKIVNIDNQIIFEGNSVTINQSLWNSLSDGQIIIRFFANDTVSHVGCEDIAIIKETNGAGNGGGGSGGGTSGGGNVTGEEEEESVSMLISFGHFYFLFMIIGMIGLLVYYKKRL